MRLTDEHISDLTEPRYVEKIQSIGGKQFKVIVDTHSSRGKEGMPISIKFSMDTDLTMRIDDLNGVYHNFVAKCLGFDIESAIGLSRINRSSW